MRNPFDRVNIGLRERPLSTDHNRTQTQLDNALRSLFGALVAPRATDVSMASAPRSGFIGDGYQVVPANPVAMSVQVSAGFGFVYNAADIPTDIGAPDLQGVDDICPWKPVVLNAPVTFAVPAAPAGPNTRIDIIEVKVDRRLEDSIVRRQLDVATRAFLDHNFYKTLAFSHDGRTGFVNSPAASVMGISYKVGAAANPGVEPAVTAGYVKIATINVGSGVATIDFDAIADHRPLLIPGGAARFGGQWRLQYNGGNPIVTCRHVFAPPGIRLGLLAQAGSARGSGAFYAIGGEIAKATALVQVHRGDGGAGTDWGVAEFAVAHFNPTTPQDPVAMTTGEQPNALAAVPSLKVGAGQKFAKFPFVSTYQAAGATNNTGVLLEDMFIHLSGFLSY